mgnify:CR=1 FL=1
MTINDVDLYERTLILERFSTFVKRFLELALYLLP